jgi:hypothetical protein
MAAKKSFWARLTGGATALSVAGALTLTGAIQAQAIGLAEVQKAAEYAQKAYDIYQKFFGNQLSLEQAEQQIVAAIAKAQTAITAEIDRLAGDDIQACTRDAVTNFVDIDRMSPDTAMAFALSTTSCVDSAQVDIANLPTLAAVDQVGFALNTLGPIALLARAHVGFATDTLKQTIITGHTQNIQRLTPTNCRANPLWSDAGPGDPVEVVLMCNAYDGTLGENSVFLQIRRSDPLPPLDYTSAINQAVVGTSYPVSQAALAAI